MDKAFKEFDGRGPVYLFFSVNASGHFCGVAEMLTPLDYSVSSNVWAQNDKWKGVMKLRWIYIKGESPRTLLFWRAQRRVTVIAHSTFPFDD